MANEISKLITPDGVSHDIKDSVARQASYDVSNKVDKTGDSMSGPLDLLGSELHLKTTSSSSNDSGDIVWFYGNGQEKARIWTDNDLNATNCRFNIRAYSSSGAQLFSGKIPLLTDVTDRVAKAGDTMSDLLKFTNTSKNIEVPARSISYVEGAKGNAGLYMPHTYNKDEWGPILCVQNKAGGSWSVGSYNGEELEFVNFTKANIDSSTNTARCIWKLSPTNGFVGPWNGITDDHNTNNTSNTWVPVYTNNKLQHRVIPTAYNNAPWTANSVVSLNGYSATTVPSTTFMAYWNGAYNNSGNSNLRYTAAGDLVTYEQSYTRNHASVSYTEHLRCWRSGKVVTLGGYFSCSGSIAANTLLYTLPSPKFVIYFTAKHETANRMYNFNLQTNGQLKTNEAIAGGNYLVCFTYVCA